jgi:hypothetical protein
MDLFMSSIQQTYAEAMENHQTITTADYKKAIDSERKFINEWQRRTVYKPITVFIWKSFGPKAIGQFCIDSTGMEPDLAIQLIGFATDIEEAKAMIADLKNYDKNCKMFDYLYNQIGEFAFMTIEGRKISHTEPMYQKLVRNDFASQFKSFTENLKANQKLVEKIKAANEIDFEIQKKFHEISEQPALKEEEVDKFKKLLTDSKQSKIPRKEQILGLKIFPSQIQDLMLSEELRMPESCRSTLKFQVVTADGQMYLKKTFKDI